LKPSNAFNIQYSVNPDKHKPVVPFSRIAPLVIMCASTLIPNVTYALNPSQQAIVNYFTNSALCTSGGYGGSIPAGGYGGSIPAQQPVFGEALPRNTGISNTNKQIRLTGSSAFLVPGGGSYSCPSLGGGAFQTGVELLLNSSAINTNAVLQGLAAEEVISMGTMNIEINGIQMTNLNAHVSGLHQGSMGMRYAAIPAKKLTANGLKTGGAASASKNGMGLFMNVKAKHGDKDTTTRETGFDYNAYGLTGGMDFRLNNMIVMGVAAGYGVINADYKGSTGFMDMQGYSLSVFGTLYKQNQYYIDGIINLTRNNFDSNRVFVDPNSITQTAITDTNGDTLNIGLGIGYEHNDQNWTIGPFARLNYTRVQIDAFSESGAGPWGVQFDEQKITSFEGVVGMQVSKTISKPWGVLVPQLRVELVHQFENDSRVINSRFVGAVQNSITTNLLQPTDEPDRNYFNISLATSAQFSHGRSAYIQYTGLVGLSTVSAHGIEMGIRWDY